MPEVLLVLACIGIFVWYVYRITRVDDALNEMANELLKQADLDDQLFLEVSQYVRTVVLPELTWHNTMKRPDDERTERARALVAALAARAQRPDLIDQVK